MSLSHATPFSKLQNQTIKPKLFWTNKLKCYLIFQFNKINFEGIITLVLFWFSLFLSPLLNSGKRKIAKTGKKKPELGRAQPPFFFLSSLPHPAPAHLRPSPTGLFAFSSSSAPLTRRRQRHRPAPLFQRRSPPRPPPAPSPIKQPSRASPLPI